MKYGKLQTIAEPYRRFPKMESKVKALYVLCRCDCGDEREYLVNNLKKINHTTSCGCHRRMIRHIHGLSKHPLFSVWKSMIQRCYNEKNKSFPLWGGRGVRVCEQWLGDFIIFYKWSLDNGYKSGLSIDRTNNDGNYEPGNCRFVTKKINNRNKGSTILTDLRAKHIRILYRFSNRTQKQIAELYGVSRTCINSITCNYNWT